jgi:ABC-type transport system involved in multi-copper enzyme maturation permease subunit
LDEADVQGMFIIIFTLLGAVSSAVLPATTITSEKESRAWPLLLTTTLDDSQIIIGKFLGSFKRLLPVWSLLILHLFIFTVIGLIHPVALFQMSLVVVEITVLLSCSGLYLSSRFRHTTTAVIMNFIFAVTIWIFIPGFTTIVAAIFRIHNDLLWLCIDTNPFFQAGNIISAAAGSVPRLHYNVNFNGSNMSSSMDVIEYTAVLLGFTAAYLFGGFLFALRAMTRLRRDIF